VVRELSRRRLAFIIAREHLGEGRIGPQLRAQFSGKWVANENFDQASGNAVIASGEADAVAYGKLFLANPDLPQRFKANAELNAVNFGTVYAEGALGYTDYPALS
jgi:2,4-dienoyl-CoA reductase-like NADH-dependent reductase (Old Yellow Enzyme family)